jgi:hypothetical protein
MPGSVAENRCNEGETHEEPQSAAATMWPQSAMGIRVLPYRLDEVAAAMSAPASRSRSRRNETTLMAGVAAAKPRPMKQPTAISGQPRSVDPAQSCPLIVGVLDCLDFKTQIDDGVGVEFSRFADQRPEGLQTGSSGAVRFGCVPIGGGFDATD